MTGSGPRRVGIIGAGSIGGSLARRLLAGEGSGLELAFLASRTPRALGGVTTVPFEEALGIPADLVVEAAHPDVTRAHGATIIARSDYLPLSTTALVDDDLRARLIAVAGRSVRRLLLPHGALVGAEALWEWRAHWREVTIRMEKHPRNVDWAASGSDAGAIDGRTTVHDGSVRAVAGRFPRNVNAMVTCALATVGLDRTRAVLVVDPALDDARLGIEAISDDGATLRIERRQPIHGVSGTEMAESAWGSLLAATGTSTFSII